MKKERATTSDEQRERMLIAEQIERAAAESSTSILPSSTALPAEEGLKRDETSEKVVLSFSAKTPPTTAASTSISSSGLKVNLLKPAANPLKANPLKRPNIFKSADVSSSREVNEKKRPASVTAAERLIIEEQERKRRKMDREGLV